MRPLWSGIAVTAAVEDHQAGWQVQVG